jgi:uncharacterized delta-60 repeat protein
MEPKSVKPFGCKLLVVFWILIGNLFVFGAPGDVDLSFNAHPSKELIYNGSGFNSSLIVQPDGKILIYGGIRVINGTTVNRIVRLNTDGSIDSSFNCLECNKFYMSNALLQPDGKIIIGGSTPVGSFSKSKTIRVNSDGSLDNSFSVQFSETLEAVNYGTVMYSLQSDGKIFIGQNLQAGGQSNITIYRLNSNGSVDSSFTAFTTNTRLGRGFVSGITPLPDGKLYVYGATVFGTFTRLNANGTEDTTYEKPSFTSDVFQIPPSVGSIIVRPDGKVVIAGSFNTVNGLSKGNLTRLNANGSVDLMFADQTDFVIPPVREYPDGKLLILKRVDIAGYYLPVKLTADGTPDQPFNLPANLISVHGFGLTNTNQIYIYGVFLENGKYLNKLARLNADGSLDTGFNVTIAAKGIVNGLAIQADGKVVMVGDFDRVNGAAKPTIARVNADGSLDAGFDGGSGFDQAPRDVTADADGKLLVYGLFSSFKGAPRPFFARLLTDGGLDTGFNPVLNDYIQTLALQPDGKILIGGQFTTVNGQTVKKIARLNADGSFDASFDPLFGSVTQINSIFVQADGKIMVGGSFLGVGGFNRQNLVRLNANGSLDDSFNAGSIDTVRHTAQISNGKYFAATTVIRKLNPDGTADNSYVSPSFGNTSVSSLTLRFLVLPNEGVVVVGDFNVVGGTIHRGLAALFPNGQLATQTYPVGANGSVFDIVRQTDGKIIVGGDFDLIEYVPRSGTARLAAPVLSKITNFDYDGDGRADFSVFRPSENKWYILRSSDSQVVQAVFAVTGDVPTPADYDGDGKTDISIFRPSAGDWWTLSSLNGAQIYGHWGQMGDIPLPSDFDGDGKADSIVYRPSNGIWYRVSSANGAVSTKHFGAAGDKPLVGDFDGDGKSEPAIFRPSTGDWWWQSSLDNIQRAVHWGAEGDIPVPADYDGDGKTDFAVFRPSNGGWYILRTGEQNYTILQFGLAGDKPVAADYDGDGKADVAVFRPSTGTWYLLQTTSGFGAVQWGAAGDIPSPGAFLP